MTFGGAAGAWLIAALVLGIAELLVPGVFLVFLAIAAAITGAAVLVLGDLPLSAQLASFGAWSVAAVLIGRRWYRDFPVGGGDATLNDRGRRLLGQRVEVIEAIAADIGRVRIGDGSWPARGADAAVGEWVTVVAVENGIVVVERPGAIDPG